MPSFFIHRPPCVFIHNPKTGGQALRQILLQGEFDGPVTGPLPVAWQSHFSFSFVRNPFDRLVSAWKMFTQGIEDTGWRVPRDVEPNMSLADFLEIVTDESIGYGESESRDGKMRIRNHTLPQTHEFYSIDQAQFVGRFENYDADVRRIFETLGITRDPPLPRHTTRRGPYQSYYDAGTRRTAEQYYSRDLEQFGYSFDG